MNRLPRSVLAALLFALPSLAGCHSPDPAWSKMVVGVRGEPTITGAPATVPSFATPPAIDGKLDDPAWQRAVVLAPLVAPGDGEEIPGSPVSGFAKLGWDRTHLYLGVVVRDRSPSSPFSPGDLDPHVWGRSSGIELILQPGDPHDNRDYYELQVDVHGAIFDSHFDDYNAPRTGSGAQTRFGHQEWSSQIDRAVFVAPGRFYAIELALPFSALAPGRTAIPPKPGDVWRLNLYTFRDGQRHALAWSPIRGQGNFHRASRFGRIRFE